MSSVLVESVPAWRDRGTKGMEETDSQQVSWL